MENVKKESVFYCDIIGTFDSGREEISQEERQKQVTDFVENLYTLMEHDNVEKLSFSFISSEDINLVVESADELSQYIDPNKIKLGAQYGGNQCYKDGKIFSTSKNKADQIKDDLNQNHNVSSINSVYYADDSMMNHVATALIQNDDKFSRVNVVSFIPGQTNEAKCTKFFSNAVSSAESNLNGLNKTMKQYIKTQTIEAEKGKSI